MAKLNDKAKKLLEDVAQADALTKARKELKVYKPPTGPNPIEVDQYLGGGAPWNKDGVRRMGWGCISVLEFIWGRKLDQVVMGYVHALRPSSVRITDSGILLDCRVWRVTIWIDKKKFVDRIEQEVEVLLPNGVAHADALRLAKNHGIDSAQVKWHEDATGYVSGLGGYRKMTAGGSVPWTFKAGRNKKLWRKKK